MKILNTDQLIKLLRGKTYKWSQIHHTWKPSHKDFNGKNHLSLQQGMKNYHMNNRGWSDIGQHVSLMPDGSWVTGRDFDRTPAGIKGYNTGAFMVEMVGDFDIGKDRLEGPQLESMIQLQHFLVNNCGAEILFHREHAAKSCPGTGIHKSEFLTLVANFEGGKPMKLEKWQFDMLANSYKKFYELGILSSDQWQKKAAERKITVDEATFLNAVIMDRLK